MQFRRDKRKIRFCFNRGGVFAYATEAVWGLGCDPANETAVRRILEVKQRPWHKGLIVVTGQLEHVLPLFQHLSPELEARARGYWPGATTLLIPDSTLSFSPWVRGKHDTIAIRVSTHPFIQWFSQNVSPFLVSTSANLAGQSPCRHEWQVQARLKQQVDYVVPGATLGYTKPSQIIDLESDEIMRL